VATRARRRPGRAPTTARLESPERIPVWVPPVTWALLTLLVFRESLLGGVPLLGHDTMALSYFARNFYTEFVQSVGRFPHWNPLLFGGLPFIDGMHGDIFYPPSLALFWMEARTMWAWKMALHIFLAGAFMHLWLRGIGLRRGPALFGGVAYMLGAQLVSLTLPGGDGKLFVSALAPLVFWLAERAVRTGTPGSFAFFALGVAAIVFTSHMQLAYFCIWGVSLYFLFRVVQRWRAERNGALAARLVGLYALAGVLGVGAAAIQFLPPLEYLREWSHRADRTVEAQDPEAAYAFSTSWSLHPEEVAALVVPEFVGDNAQTETRSGRTYWGRNPFKLNHEYSGFIPIALLPLLFLRRRDPRAWFFAGLAALSLLYALGANTPFFRLFYLIPGVSLFRAPSLIIFLYALSLVTLGALALQRLLDWAAAGEAAERRAAGRTLWIVAGVMALLALLASSGALTSIWISVFYADIAPGRMAALQENMPSLQAGFWIAAALAALVAGTWEAVSRGLIGRREAVIALTLLAALDLYRAGRPFVRSTVLMNRMADPVLFQPDESIAYLQAVQAQGGVFRVYDLGVLLETGPAYPENTLAVHGLEQLAGHHGNEIGRYRALIGGSDAAPHVATSELRLLNVANVEYIVLPQRIDAPGFEEVHVGRRSAVYRNTDALPRAFLAGSYEVVEASAAVERLLAADFEPRTTVLLDAEPPPELRPEPGAGGQVEWVERGNDEIVLRVRADAPALLVLLDNDYPAWRAEVNGEQTTILRANHTFRAVAVPAGESTVRFRYDTGRLKAPAFASLGVLLLLTAVGIGDGWRRRRRAEATPVPARPAGPGSGPGPGPGP
jgi:hypothetical protein